MKAALTELHIKDTESIDWKKALSSYLKKTYGSEQWSYFFDESLAKDLNHLRTNANGELAPEALLEQNLKYYAFIEQLNIRLGNNSSQLKLNFTWYDAEYSINATSNTKYTQHTLTFEKSAIIYNIGVIYSQLAQESLTDDYKTSVSAMTKAMSCFTFLSENFFNSPSIDLHAENTQFLANLCHAQAQEMFLLKLVNSTPTAEKQASLISKLAVTTYQLYEQCVAFLKKPEGGVVSYGEPRWNTTLTCKANLYRSIAAHNYSIFLEQQNKMGDAIAFSKQAHVSIVNALPFKAWLKDYIDFDGLKETIDEKTQQLIKDNDYIYHDPIPQTISLESIKAMDAIKPIKWDGITDPYMKSVSDKCNILYKGIVPMAVYEKESIYSEEKASLLRREVEANDTSNLEYDSFMEYTKLPALIVDLEKRYKSGNVNVNENPQVEFMKEQLHSFAKNIQTSSYSDIQEQIKTITTKRKEIIDTLSQLPDSQKENAVKLKSSLIEASKSDEKLLALMKPFMKELNLLKDDNALWSEFNQFESSNTSGPSLLDIDDTKTEKILQKLDEIKKMNESLRTLKDERNHILTELKGKINDDDITSKLIELKKASENEFQELFNNELEKFEPLSSRLEAAIFKQISLINEIKVALDNIFAISGFREKNPDEDNREKGRKEFYDRLEKTTTNFSIFSSDIQKGLHFYDMLLSMSKELLKSSEKTNSSPQDDGFHSTTAPPLPEQPYKPENIPPYTPMVPGGMDYLNNQMNSLNIGEYSTPPTDSQFTSRLYDNSQPPNKDNNGTHSSAPQPPSRNYASHHAPSIPAPPSSRNSTSLLGSVGSYPPQSSQPPAYNDHMDIPQLPPRHFSGTNPSLINKTNEEEEEQELQRNPTAFYDKSPVFDENLYFKYGK
ncbi:vacuolar-sorting protein Bro1p [Monosporozyma servazzii]